MEQQLTEWREIAPYYVSDEPLSSVHQGLSELINKDNPVLKMDKGLK